MINDLVIKKYPKDAVLTNDVKILLRPMKSEDIDALYTFFQAIPEDDKLFLKEDISQKEVIESWCKSLNYENVLPLLALHNNIVIGNATLHTLRRSWMRHIARLRVTIHPDYRMKGLATQLIRELIDLAKQTDLEKLDAEFMREQEAAIAVFKSLGFQQIALMENHVIDIRGKPHDLVIMALDIK